MTDFQSVAPKQPRSASAGRAHVAATIVEIVGWVIALAGLAVGLILIGTASNYADPTEARLVGLATIIGGIIYASVIVMVGAYIQSRTEQ